MVAKPKEFRGKKLCSGCLGVFKYTELFDCHITDELGMKFSMPYCEKCSKEEHSNVKDFKIGKRITEPRKKKTTGA